MSRSTFLVPFCEGDNFVLALSYAARRAKTSGACVAFLYVVESQEIEAWSGVERAMADEAFDRARKEMTEHERRAEELSGASVRTYYAKGDYRAALLDLIEKEKHIAALVLPAQTKDGSRHPLIHEMSGDKGIKKLIVPLIIVPAACRCDDSGK